MVDVKVRSVADSRARYETRATGATDWYRKGVENPRRNPMEAASAAFEDWKARMTSLETHEKWKRNVDATSQSDWQEPTLELGAARYGPGVRFGADKWEKFYSAFKPELESILSEVLAMSAGSHGERVDRSVRFQNLAHEFSYRGR